MLYKLLFFWSTISFGLSSGGVRLQELGLLGAVTSVTWLSDQTSLISTDSGVYINYSHNLDWINIKPHLYHSLSAQIKIDEHEFNDTFVLFKVHVANLAGFVVLSTNFGPFLSHSDYESWQHYATSGHIQSVDFHEGIPGVMVMALVGLEPVVIANTPSTESSSSVIYFTSDFGATLHPIDEHSYNPQFTLNHQDISVIYLKYLESPFSKMIQKNMSSWIYPKISSMALKYYLKSEKNNDSTPEQVDTFSKKQKALMKFISLFKFYTKPYTERLYNSQVKWSRVPFSEETINRLSSCSEKNLHKVLLAHTNNNSIVHYRMLKKAVSITRVHFVVLTSDRNNLVLAVDQSSNIINPNCTISNCPKNGKVNLVRMQLATNASEVVLTRSMSHLKSTILKPIQSPHYLVAEGALNTAILWAEDPIYHNNALQCGENNQITSGILYRISMEFPVLTSLLHDVVAINGTIDCVWGAGSGTSILCNTIDRQHRIQTRITHDLGHTWKRPKAHGEFLNIAGPGSGNREFLSDFSLGRVKPLVAKSVFVTKVLNQLSVKYDPSALGLIYAVGNVGPALGVTFLRHLTPTQSSRSLSISDEISQYVIIKIGFSLKFIHYDLFRFNTIILSIQI